MADNEKDLQDMLDITMRISEKYHIVFGEEKSDNEEKTPTTNTTKTRGNEN